MIARRAIPSRTERTAHEEQPHDRLDSVPVPPKPWRPRGLLQLHLTPGLWLLALLPGQRGPINHSTLFPQGWSRRPCWDPHYLLIEKPCLWCRPTRRPCGPRVCSTTLPMSCRKISLETKPSAALAQSWDRPTVCPFLFLVPASLGLSSFEKCQHISICLRFCFLEHPD